MWHWKNQPFSIWKKKMVFGWFLKEIPLWKKCLFSKVGYSAFPCQDFDFPQVEKCKRTWIREFLFAKVGKAISPYIGNYLSKSGISYFQRRKNFHIHKGNFHLPKLEKPFLHIWLTTYPKAEFYISKERKIQWPWKIDFQHVNVDNQENLNLVACLKFLMIYP